MQPVRFYELSRSAQERFVGSVNGTGLPAPILRGGLTPREPVAWIGASVGSLVLLYLFARAGYGNASSSLARQGIGWMVADVILVGLAVFGVVRALSILREHRASPFRRGIYVFPVGVIDARTDTLRMYPIEEMSNVAGPDGSGITLSFGGTQFAFPVSDPIAAVAAREALDSARRAMSEGEPAAPGDSVRPKAMAALDPLQGYANPLMSSDRIVRSTPAWATFGWALAVVTGAAVGVSLWFVRNARSDDALYERAVAANDSASLRAYLDKASRHEVEVSQVLLPRAELRDAQSQGTVAAIEKFIGDHPKTAILPEAQTALRAAMLVELQTAVQAGTLTALDDFSHRHPSGQVNAELAAARHGVYQAALARYVAQAPPKAQAETAFVQRLISWVEKKGPQVELRFHRLRSKSMDKADGAVTKHRAFKGAISFPTRYFDAKAVKPDEDALGAAIIQRFGAVFPPEIIAMTVGEPITDPEAPLPTQVASPTMFIEHGPAWSGSIFATKNPRGLFVGLELSFEASFRLPDDTKPVKVKVDGWHMPSMSAATDAERPEDSVYADMRGKAFDQFKKRLLAAFFTDGT
jgi:hypothetical protein